VRGVSLRHALARWHSGGCVHQHVTKDIVQILQAMIILFVAAEGFFRGTFRKFGWSR
jgi:ABC-type uncharacterized transport system permease subunit